MAKAEAVRFCPHCGAVGSTRVGTCSVCQLGACDRCGNLQHIKGEVRIVHDACLKDTGDSFSMIKFVK